MTTKASIVVMSHLSDIQEEISMGYADNGIKYHINFVKYIILQTGGDLNKEIDPDVMFKEFGKKHGK
jgi:hypothetical protein